MAVLLVTFALLAYPAVASASAIIHANFALGQITPAYDANGNLVTLVNGTLQLRNTGTDATEGLMITQQVFIPALGVTYDLGVSDDLLYHPSVGPGETICYGLGGYVPYAPNTAYVLSARVTATNSRFHDWTLSGGGYFDEDTGVTGHMALPGWFNC